MVTWGIMAAATAFVKSPIQFYIVRFLLGVAEAGFFPGVIVYLTHWFPSRDRAKALSYFLIASPIAMMIGPALSRLMIHHGTTVEVAGEMIEYPLLLGLKGGNGSILLGDSSGVVGILVIWLLPDKPRHAKWLTAEESEALESQLEEERRIQASAGHVSLIEALTSPRVLWLSFAYFGIVTANYGIEFSCQVSCPIGTS